MSLPPQPPISDMLLVRQCHAEGNTVVLNDVSSVAVRTLCLQLRIASYSDCIQIWLTDESHYIDMKTMQTEMFAFFDSSLSEYTVEDRTCLRDGDCVCAYILAYEGGPLEQWLRCVVCNDRTRLLAVDNGTRTPLTMAKHVCYMPAQFGRAPACAWPMRCDDLQPVEVCG
jgi:hypothetical protein